MIVVDFETKPIENRPAYPPEPVGVAIKRPGKPSYYRAWAHPDGNNCLWEQGVQEIQDIWRGSEEVLFHNGKFDQDVAETFMGVDPLPWHRAHDTLFQLFLIDPDAKSLSLKPAAEYWLNWPPTERDELMEWILHNVPGLSPKGKGLKAPGAWICLAPVRLVGPYACGDVDRTLALHEFLMPQIQERGMSAAYDRERKLMPHLLESERAGLYVNIDLLSQDVPTYQESLQVVEGWLRERLGVPDLNFNAKGKLGAALLTAEGILNVTSLPKTKKGKPSVSKKNLIAEMYGDPAVFNAIGYRNRLVTCLGTFMEKWLSMADNLNRIFTNWHQTRTSHADLQKGARTGRVTSSDPPFTNMAKSWEDRNDAYEHPAFLGVPPLPLVRQYIIPDAGTEWRHRDWRQQEMRIIAHYENGQLMRAYQADPFLDFHQLITDNINAVTGKNIHRKICKLLDLGMAYGEGKEKLARQLHIPMNEALAIVQNHRDSLPGVERLKHVLRLLAKNGDPVVTWGGRQYYCEEPKIVDGKMKTFEYKQLNRLVQPSAADQAKEALIRYHAHPKKQGRFLAAVYDEINTCAEDGDSEDAVLKEVMESIESDVAMMTEGKKGYDWAHLEKVEDAN